MPRREVCRGSCTCAQNTISPHRVKVVRPVVTCYTDCRTPVGWNLGSGVDLHAEWVHLMFYTTLAHHRDRSLRRHDQSGVDYIPNDHERGLISFWGFRKSTHGRFHTTNPLHSAMCHEASARIINVEVKTTEQSPIRTSRLRPRCPQNLTDGP